MVSNRYPLSDRKQSLSLWKCVDMGVAKPTDVRAMDIPSSSTHITFIFQLVPLNFLRFSIHEIRFYGSHELIDGK